MNGRIRSKNIRWWKKRFEKLSNSWIRYGLVYILWSWKCSEMQIQSLTTLELNFNLFFYLNFQNLKSWFFAVFLESKFHLKNKIRNHIRRQNMTPWNPPPFSIFFSKFSRFSTPRNNTPFSNFFRNFWDLSSELSGVDRIRWSWIGVIIRGLAI